MGRRSARIEKRGILLRGRSNLGRDDHEFLGFQVTAAAGPAGNTPRVAPRCLKDFGVEISFLLRMPRSKNKLCCA